MTFYFLFPKGNIFIIVYKYTCFQEYKQKLQMEIACNLHERIL